MKAVIIEDELLSSRRLERMLFDYNYEIVASLVSVKSAIKWFKNNKHPDILFLDIHLSDGLCFDIFKAVKIESTIVFTTAFSEYSIKAFDYNSVSYLLKPINKEQLGKAIEKANTFHKKANELQNLKNSIEQHNLETFKNKYIIKVGQKIKIIDVANIECFYSINNATYLYSNSVSYSLDLALINIINELNSINFFQVNRKFIVNINSIKKINLHLNSRLKLELNTFSKSEIIVSRERVKDFKKWID